MATVNILTDSLKRLYESQKLTIAQVGARVKKGSISVEEFTYITGEEYKE